eukprot:g4085.t1
MHRRTREALEQALEELKRDYVLRELPTSGDDGVASQADEQGVEVDAEEEQQVDILMRAAAREEDTYNMTTGGETQKVFTTVCFSRCFLTDAGAMKWLKLFHCFRGIDGEGENAGVATKALRVFDYSHNASLTPRILALLADYGGLVCEELRYSGAVEFCKLLFALHNRKQKIAAATSSSDRQTQDQGAEDVEGRSSSKNSKTTTGGQDETFEKEVVELDAIVRLPRCTRLSFFYRVLSVLRRDYGHAKMGEKAFFPQSVRFRSIGDGAEHEEKNPKKRNPDEHKDHSTVSSALQPSVVHRQRLDESVIWDEELPRMANCGILTIGLQCCRQRDGHEGEGFNWRERVRVECWKGSIASNFDRHWLEMVMTSVAKGSVEGRKTKFHDVHRLLAEYPNPVPVPGVNFRGGAGGADARKLVKDNDGWRAYDDAEKKQKNNVSKKGQLATTGPTATAL